MGRKVHPKCFRLSTVASWDSLWFSKKRFSEFLQEDEQIRTFLMEKLKEASVDTIQIERSVQQVTVTVFSAKPGFIIGRAGAGIEETKTELTKKVYPGKRVSLTLNVKEVKKPSLSARIVAQQVASELERRMPFRRSMKSAIDRVMKGGAKGVRISLGGRLNGADIARTERLLQGQVPLHNLRADINYARVTARTNYGAVGLRVWINRGEVFERDVKEQPAAV